MSDVVGHAGLDDDRRSDLNQAMYVGLCRTRHQMLGVHGDGALDKVEVERLLHMETTKAFDRAVADARAADFSWEQITQRVPGLFRTYGPQAAERLFEMVAVVGSSLGELHARWRCSQCEGFVRDYGPYGGHPLDAEPGHREDCERQTNAIRAYETGLESYGQPTADIRQTVLRHDSALATRAEATELEGRGLGL